jgi:hypothetical protein
VPLMCSSSTVMGGQLQAMGSRDTDTTRRMKFWTCNSKGIDTSCELTRYASHRSTHRSTK